MKKLNLPNMLTLLRLALTPVLIVLMIFRYTVSSTILAGILAMIVVLLFSLIAITDFLDGYIARKYNLITDFGKLLDPIADKVFVFSVLILLAKYDIISVVMVVILLAREFVVTAVRTLIVEKGGKIVAASNTAKWKTAAQMLATIFALVFSFSKVINSIVMLPALVLSIISMVEYVKMAYEYFDKE